MEKIKIILKQIWVSIKTTLFTWTAEGLRKAAAQLDQLKFEKEAIKKK